MKKIETPPSPEKLLRQVTEEAVNALALGGPDKIGDEAPMEAGVMLIAKAWGLPQESLQAAWTCSQRNGSSFAARAARTPCPTANCWSPTTAE